MNLKSFLDDIRFKNIDGQYHLWDIVRQKWLISTREEVVRQAILQFLIKEKKYSKKLIAVEKMINYYSVKKRYDIVVFNTSIEPIILIECKSPEIALDSKAFYQISAYNEMLNGQHLWLSNGHQNVILAKSEGSDDLLLIDDIPSAQD